MLMLIFWQVQSVLNATALCDAFGTPTNNVLLLSAKAYIDERYELEDNSERAVKENEMNTRLQNTWENCQVNFQE